MHAVFTAQQVQQVPDLTEDIKDIIQMTEGPCKYFTNETEILGLRSAFLFKTYYIYALSSQDRKEYVITYCGQLKLLSIIHALRSFHIFVNNFDFFYKYLEYYANNAEAGKVILQRFGFTEYKTDQNRFLRKTEEMDTIYSGLVKCRYAREVSYDVVWQMRDFCYKNTTQEEEKSYLDEIFRNVPALFAYNVCYNINCHRVQLNELIMAIIFFLDKDERQFITQICNKMLIPYGQEFQLKYHALWKVFESIMEVA